MYSEKMDAVKSTHKSEVVRVVKEPHPNADNLAVVRVFGGGHIVVVNKHQWNDGDLGVYVVPDSIVPTHKPEFSFLVKDPEKDPHYRVKSRRLRQLWSEGLLVPCPPGLKEGDDAAPLLGVTRYEPPEPGSTPGKGLYLGGEAATPPNLVSLKYDLESWNKYKYLLNEGEEILCHEKIHGCNAKYVYHEGVMYCGSRTEWKKEFPSYDHINKENLLSRGVSEEKAEDILNRIKNKPPQQNLWWKLYRKDQSIEAFCKHNPGVVLYGECFGAVQDLSYGHQPGDVSFAAFDAWDSKEYRFLEVDELQPLLERWSVSTAPLLYRGPYSEAKVKELADGPTTINGATHCREGVVVRPVKTRHNDLIGRIVLKIVSNEYLERSK